MGTQFHNKLRNNQHYGWTREVFEESGMKSGRFYIGRSEEADILWLKHIRLCIIS
jgi:hypothetical protein